MVDPAAVNLGRAVQMRNVVTDVEISMRKSLEIQVNLRGEESSQNVSNETANTVNSENVERIVRAEEVLELRGVVAEGASNNTKDDGGPSRNETGTGSNGDEASDDAGAETDGGPLLLKTVIDQAPGDATNASREVGDDGSHDCTQIGSASRTGVESEPTNPEEDGADDNVGNVVRAVVELLGAVATTLSEHVRIGKSCAARGNMDRSSAGKVDTSHGGGPARGVPGPASDRVVDDGGPDEHVDDARKHAATFGDGTNSKSDANTFN